MCGGGGGGGGGGAHLFAAGFSFGTVAKGAMGCLKAGLMLIVAGPHVQVWIAVGNLAALDGSLGLST